MTKSDFIIEVCLLTFIVLTTYSIIHTPAYPASCSVKQFESICDVICKVDNDGTLISKSIACDGDKYSLVPIKTQGIYTMKITSNNYISLGIVIDILIGILIYIIARLALIIYFRYRASQSEEVIVVNEEMQSNEQYRQPSNTVVYVDLKSEKSRQQAGIY